MSDKGGWKQTSKFPLRMQQGIKDRKEVQRQLQAKAVKDAHTLPKPVVEVQKRCARCGNDGHTTREHDKEHRRLQKIKQELASTNRVVPMQTMNIPKLVLTNRARRRAKKRFPRGPHSFGFPQGGKHEKDFSLPAERSD